MKKIYMLFGALAMAFTANAQFQHQGVNTERGYAEKGQPVAEVPQLPADRVTIYEDDIADCDRWILSNALDEGYTQFVDLQWECGTGIQPDGPASIDALTSTTADNGFLMVDSDEYGGEEGGTGIENCYATLDSVLDFSAYDYVSLAFETQYYMWDGGSSDGNEYCLVEFSTDGGATWPDPTTYEVDEADPGMRYELWPDMGTQDPVDNPTLKVFILGTELAGEADVRMRFRWKGTWGYAWMIDDIEIFETPENDLTVVKAYAGDIINDYDYYSIPQSQTKEMTYGAVMLNNGYTDQVDAEVTIDVSGAGTSNTIETYSLTSGTLDTMWHASGFEPMDMGDYTVTITVPADDFDAGDVGTTGFEVTEFIYGHNNDENLVQRGFDQDYEYAIGNVYYMEEDAYLGGLNIYFGDNTSLEAGETFEINVYVVGDDIQDLSNIGSAEIEADDLVIGDYANYTFGELFGGNGAIELFAGNSYVVEVRKFFGASRIYIASNVLDEDFSTVNYGPFGVDDAENWFVSWGWTPAVRMNLDANISVNELTDAAAFSMSQNFPNPANGLTTVRYNLTDAAAVTLQVFDMTGREVMNISEGTRVAGEHTIDILTLMD